MDLAGYRDLAVRAARAGAAVAVAWTDRGDALHTEEKSRGDYVTAVDRAAEAAVLEVLRSGTPEVPVLAEESGGELADLVWLVDPIDGTTNFLRGFPVVGVSVGLLRDGQPVAGAVAAPYLGATWSAARGQGAHDHRGRPLQVGGPGGRGLVATGFPFRRHQLAARYRPVLERALETFEDLRRAGAASLDLAYTAAGTFDGYFELGLAPWDVCAGGLLVTEAGGRVTDWDGDPLNCYRTGDILAGSPRCHELLLSLVRRPASGA